MKKVLSIILVVTLLFSIYIPAYGQRMPQNKKEYDSSFADSEGKKNTVHLEMLGSGKTHVDYYIENILIQTVDVELFTSTSTGTEMIKISIKDVKTDIVHKSVECLSKYISNELTAVEPMVTSTYSRVGIIDYNAITDEAGVRHNDKLYIYHSGRGITSDYKTVNVVQEYTFAFVVAVIAAQIQESCSELAWTAETLLNAILYTAGVAVVGGIIQGTVSTSYYVRKLMYDVKAKDTKTGMERYYTGDIYQVLLPGGTYSSSYCYEGYLPWNSTTVAYWMFCDFWGYQYPGVNSFISG